MLSDSTVIASGTVLCINVEKYCPIDRYLLPPSLSFPARDAAAAAAGGVEVEVEKEDRLPAFWFPSDGSLSSVIMLTPAQLDDSTASWSTFVLSFFLHVGQ